MVNYQKNYYKILGLQLHASQNEIKKAFRALVKTHHPDAVKNTNAISFLQEVYEAYEILSDPEKKYIYDLHINKELSKKNKIASYITTAINRNILISTCVLLIMAIIILNKLIKEPVSIVSKKTKEETKEIIKVDTLEDKNMRENKISESGEIKF